MKIDNKHLIVHAQVENPLIQELDAYNFLLELVHLVGMNICPNGGPHVYYVLDEGNEGICSVVMLKTSHASCHIWTNLKEIQFDLYSCSDFDPDVVLSYINDWMKISKGHYLFIDRNSEEIFKFIDTGRFNANNFKRNE